MPSNDNSSTNKHSNNGDDGLNRTQENHFLQQAKIPSPSYSNIFAH